VKRAALFVLGVAVAAGIIGVAAPVASPPSPVIAGGVLVNGVLVGGLTSEPARARLREAVARPLMLSFRGERWRVPPRVLDVTASVDEAVSNALLADTDEKVPLRVRVPHVSLSRYVDRLARRIDRPPRNAKLTGLVRGRPVLEPEVVGISVRPNATARAIAAALERGSRRLVRVRVDRLVPRVTRDSFGPVIVIDRGSNTLQLYDGTKKWRLFRVATGSPYYPTPSGTWRIVVKQRYPWWYPPASDWARGLSPVPPGPGNPLGTRWMGLSAAAVGIHGTPNPASIGYSASHGCIRMNVPEAEWLFERVRIGTPVIVV
jgi:L,D-transpeptidase catalytic domain/Putative peptidoglycan binding domain